MSNLDRNSFVSLTGSKTTGTSPPGSQEVAPNLENLGRLDQLRPEFSSVSISKQNEKWLRGAFQAARECIKRLSNERSVRVESLEMTFRVLTLAIVTLRHKESTRLALAIDLKRIEPQLANLADELSSLHLNGNLTVDSIFDLSAAVLQESCPLTTPLGWRQELERILEMNNFSPI